jgi:lipoprotein-releasing system permease protein
MIPDYFARSVALRHLRFSLGQTLASVGVVTLSVTLIIFLGALIGGLQKRLLGSVTGSISHVVIKPPDRVPLAAWQIDSLQQSNVLYVGTTVKLAQQKQKIEDWSGWLDRVEHFDERISGVSPIVDGQGILARGTKKKGVSITGVLPERHNDVVDIQSKLVQGRYFGLNASEVAIGYRLAEEFSLKLGDKIRLTSSEDVTGVYTVAGIFDTGFNAADFGTVFVALRDAQSLFQLGRAVTSIGVKLTDIFAANEVADQLKLQVPFETVSWMRENQSILSGLRAQSQSVNLILGCTILAAGLGIASILIMSVLSRQREIGILKAMGATSRQITTVFALQGGLLALAGGGIGSGVGIGLSHWLRQFKIVASTTGRMAEIFPMALSGQLIATALLTALVVGFVAAIYPAWRAARINAIEVIRST